MAKLRFGKESQMKRAAWPRRTAIRNAFAAAFDSRERQGRATDTLLLDGVP